MLGAADSTALSVMCVVNIKARVCGERTTGEDDSRWSERAASCACLPLCTQPNGFSGEEEEEETPSPDQSPTTGVACKLGSSRVRVVRVELGVEGRMARQWSAGDGKGRHKKLGDGSCCRSVCHIAWIR